MIHDPSFRTGPKRLLCRLLRRDASRADRSGTGESKHSALASREQVLASITELILDNRLELTGANLLLAHAAFCGANPLLRRRIAAKQEAGERITQDWLDEQIAEDGLADEQSYIDRLTKSLSRSIHQFGDSASSTRVAVQDYGRDIAAHVDRLSRMVAGKDAIGPAIVSSQKMAHTSRVFEERLLKAEAEAEMLRRQLDQARYDATRDTLTGLLNRRGFDAVFEAEYRKASAMVEPMCVAYCDLDHFKQINDSYGHDTGDNILRAIGQLLYDPADLCSHASRHGGEEFVVIYRGLTVEQGRERLDAIRAALAARRFVHQSSGEKIGTIRLSAGIADVFAFSDRHQALSAADQALYRAKQAGRDRVVIARFD